MRRALTRRPAGARSCNWDKWQNKHREPFQCHSLAHVTLCNVIANLICGPLLDDAAGRSTAAPAAA